MVTLKLFDMVDHLIIDNIYDKYDYRKWKHTLIIFFLKNIDASFNKLVL